MAEPIDPETLTDDEMPAVPLNPRQIERFEAAVARALTVNREKHLRKLLTTVTVAADRLLQNWSESDDAVKRDLWRALGAAVTSAEDEVYPLNAEQETPTP